MNLSNINTKYIDKTNGATGIANILVEDSGENRIIVIPGANKQVDKDYIDKNIELIKNSDIILTQLEIPLDTVSYLLALAKKYNKTTILNPAPATKLSDEIIKNSDIIIPNETELEIITNISTNTWRTQGPKCFSPQATSSRESRYYFQRRDRKSVV